MRKPTILQELRARLKTAGLDKRYYVRTCFDDPIPNFERDTFCLFCRDMKSASPFGGDYNVSGRCSSFDIQEWIDRIAKREKAEAGI